MSMGQSPEETVERYVRKFDMASFLNSALLESLRPFYYEAYETVIFEQSKIRYLYFLVDGQLRCAHYHPNGTLAVVALNTPLTVMGDVELLSNSSASTAVVTIRRSILLGIPMTTIHKHGIDDPKFLRFIINQLTLKLNDSTSLRLGNLLPVKCRLALYIMTKPEAADGNIVILPEKETLASMLGTTLRHLNRVIHELIEDGVLGSGYPGVRVKNARILNRLIGEA